MTQLDDKRVTELRGLMGDGLGSIVETMLASISAAIEQVDAALAGGDPSAAVQPAHSCRNDALLVGARDLLGAMTELEVAARDARLADARAAYERVREAWPATRQELERLARRGCPR
jgi:HPt (histidine-containing phosphotransfer) domain-containing protein